MSNVFVFKDMQIFRIYIVRPSGVQPGEAFVINEKLCRILLQRSLECQTEIPGIFKLLTDCVFSWKSCIIANDSMGIFAMQENPFQEERQGRNVDNLMKVGMGYDVHRLTENRNLILGGVKIPWEKGLLGHSDADVLIHAIMDALLGAAALGDIGQHFPDTDPAYEGISSVKLLEHVASLLEKKDMV